MNSSRVEKVWSLTDLIGCGEKEERYLKQIDSENHVPTSWGPFMYFSATFIGRHVLRKSTVLGRFVDQLCFHLLFVRLHGDISIYLHRMMF